MTLNHRLLHQKRHFKNLNGSRFFAFILVFLAHCFVTDDVSIKSSEVFQRVYTWGKVGVLGLEYFFVLSSFLITWIIFEEKKFTQHLNIRNFLIRRVLRVWPLYFLIVFIGYFGHFVLGNVGITSSELPSISNFLLFIVNFYVIYHGQEFLFFLVFLWSISIEEQFYLVWPFLLKRIQSAFPWVCLAMILISLGFRFYYVENDRQLLFNTISTFGNFGLGGILAYIAFYEKKLFHWLLQIDKKVRLALYVLLIFSIAFYHQIITFEFMYVFSRIYFSLLFAFVILDQAFYETPVVALGKNKWLDYFGKISYGLYCYHGVVITAFIILQRQTDFLQTEQVVFLWQPVIIFIFTLLLSSFSYRYIESRFLWLKQKFYA